MRNLTTTSFQWISETHGLVCVVTGPLLIEQAKICTTEVHPEYYAKSYNGFNPKAKYGTPRYMPYKEFNYNFFSVNQWDTWLSLCGNLSPSYRAGQNMHNWSAPWQLLWASWMAELVQLTALHHIQQPQCEKSWSSPGHHWWQHQVISRQLHWYKLKDAFNINVWLVLQADLALVYCKPWWSLQRPEEQRAYQHHLQLFYQWETDDCHQQVNTAPFILRKASSMQKGWSTTVKCNTYLNWSNNRFNSKDWQILFMDSGLSHPHIGLSTIKLKFLQLIMISKLQAYAAGLITQVKVLYEQRMLWNILQQVTMAISESTTAKVVNIF